MLPRRHKRSEGANLSDRSIAHHDCLDCLHIKGFCGASSVTVRSWNGEHKDRRLERISYARGRAGKDLGAVKG